MSRVAFCLLESIAVKQCEACKSADFGESSNDTNETFVDNEENGFSRRVIRRE